MDIIDRLITRVELQGGSKYVRDLTQMGASMSGFVALLAAGTAVGFGRELVQTELAVEKLNRQFSALFKGANAPAQAFAFTAQFAERTHRSIDDVRGAFLELANKGVQPTTQLLQAAAALSDRSGKDMAQTAEAVGKAWLGDRNALKEYGTTLRALMSEGSSPMGGLTGAINDLTNEWQAFKESMADDSFLTPIVQAVTGLLQITERLYQGWKVFIDLIRVGLDRILSIFNPIAKLFGLQFGGMSMNGLLKDAAALFGKKSEATAPTLNNPAVGMTNLIRQIVGGVGGQIAPIGIRPTELPGIQARFGNSIKVTLNTSDGSPMARAMEDVVNRVLEKLNRHGVFPSPMPAH